MASNKRVTRSSNLSSDFQGLIENLHDPSQLNSNVASEHVTLVEASKQDVDKLLGRAGTRGAIATSKGRAKSITAKRGRKNAFPEGEESLFYQRNVKGDVGSSGSFAVCGASASTMVDVKYGSSSGHDIFSPPSCEAMEHDKVSMQCIGVLKEGEHSGLKGDDALDEEFSMDDGCEWEFGSTAFASDDHKEDKPWDGEINIEMDKDTSSGSEKKARKRILRRANAKDKEFAEMVHKAHLLCMIARGRLVDAACDDPILQASLLSIVPDHIHFDDTQRISVSELGPFVKWFQCTFQIHPDKSANASSVGVPAKVDLVTHLLNVLHKQVGSSEEIAALSVSLLRALGITARYVAVLDVLSLKPDSSSLEASEDWDASNADEHFFSQRFLSATLASSLGQAFSQCSPQTLAMAVTNALPSPTIASPDSTRMQSLEGRMQKQGVIRSLKSGKQMPEDSLHCRSQKKRQIKFELESSSNSHLRENEVARNDGTSARMDVCNVPGSEKKRKGDLEFELQLEMAMAATSKSQMRVSGKSEIKNDTLHSESVASLEKGKGVNNNTSRSVASGSTVWSRKLGPLLNWAEVFCMGKDEGKWVHVDAGRGLLDGAERVEEAARSYKAPLRYVLAFAGNGAKDVTRRYITLWSAVAPLRVSNDWWNVTLAPLKQLEAAGTSMDFKQEEGTICQDKAGTNSSGGLLKMGTSSKQSQINDRSSLEDMELDIRACTEPLPQNQRAYKNHHLYALERWLTKYQSLHPKGPILGYCAGHPVFPRACVQGLHTAERWLREGLKVKPNEQPVKLVKNPRLVSNKPIDDSLNGVGESNSEAATTALFGKWQTEPWHPPPAVDGIVPKNERGNVELWSENCLPPGTVHISLPRIFLVAKKLEIDFAPALVGFEIRNRRSVPVFEGIVVCKEHETILLEAYAEEEYRRNEAAEKRREKLAFTRWCQLLRSVTVRQRLQAAYHISPEAPHRSLIDDETLSQNQATSYEDKNKRNYIAHEHVFPEQSQSYDEETGIRTKICTCGFTLKVEEM